MAPHSMAASKEMRSITILPSLYDRWLILVALCLITLGILMVASSSMAISERQFGQPFHFLFKQLLFLAAGLIGGVIVFRIHTTLWEKMGVGLLIVTIFLLALVLIPGVGKEVNGSMRWLGFGPLGFQVSELAKLFVIIYLAGYLDRQNNQLRNYLSGFLKPVAILGVVGILLLLEPDFGATVVIFSTAMGMMFLAGVRLRYFLIVVFTLICLFLFLAYSSPYRLERLTGFLNPWTNQFGSGYQLTQALIAFGQGGWFGVGLGDSVQKLFYLPEAYTDFLFAVIAEELGLIGILGVIALFMIFVWRALSIGKEACLMQRYFAGFLAYGLGLWLGFQVMINVGVNLGVLPTKGLTLPFISYGGSSLLVSCIVLSILLRIDHETRLLKLR